MIESVNDKGVYGTAPAKRGLSLIEEAMYFALILCKPES